jgi:hypothetical protein
VITAAQSADGIGRLLRAASFALMKPAAWRRGLPRSHTQHQNNASHIRPACRDQAASAKIVEDSPFERHEQNNTVRVLSAVEHRAPIMSASVDGRPSSVSCG